MALLPCYHTHPLQDSISWHAEMEIKRLTWLEDTLWAFSILPGHSPCNTAGLTPQPTATWIYPMQMSSSALHLISPPPIGPLPDFHFSTYSLGLQVLSFSISCSLMDLIANVPQKNTKGTNENSAESQA